MALTASSNAVKTQKPKGKPRGRPIQKGQVLNPKGRPVGARQKLSENFITTLSEDFEKHGKNTIERLRKEKPDAYVRVVSDLVPKDVNLNVNATEAFVSAWEFINEASGDETE